MSRSARPRLALAGAVATAVAAVGVPATHGNARADSASLPLGDPDLTETRTVETLAPGVTLTRIERGTTPAAQDEIATTTRGPWRVAVLTVDRSAAVGHLRTTYGPDVARSEPVTDLVAGAGALAGVNASFFAEGADYPGDPVGLSVVGGRMVSNPAPQDAPDEYDVLLHARTNRLSFGRYTWRGRLTNRRTGRVLRLDYVEHPPVVPVGCRRLTDPTDCTVGGEVSSFTRAFGDGTPQGSGVEVVLDRRGCVVRTARSRGTTLSGAQTSVQATGAATRTLLRVRRGGCLSRTVRLFTSGGHAVALDSSVYAVSGRFRLAQAGQELVPSGPGPFFDRNPRTVVGRTGAGQVVVVVIDGRQPSSVGTTMQETADVVHALGLRDAVNLDGGGSTTLSVDGRLANSPSGPTPRPVGDALVYVDAPFE